ncbi:MAG: hypothetical protein AAGC43_04605 [Bacteroidota bacterium]
MSLDLTGLSDYTNEHKNELIAKAVASAKSAKVLNLQTGYKSSGTVNIFDTDVQFQQDAAGRTPNGTTTLSQRVLTVGAIKVEEDIDVKGLNRVYAQHMLKAGSSDDVLPFAEMYLTRKAQKIADALEKAIWRGDTALADNAANRNLRRFDGLIKIIDAEASVIDGNTGNVLIATGITKENVIAIMDGVYESIPVEVLESDEAEIYCGFDVFRLFTQALKDANMFHYDGKSSDYEIEIPGTNVKIIALNGLSGTSRIFAGKSENFVVGTDLEHEDEEMDLWYSKDDKIVKFDTAFKYGTQVAFPEEIVEFSLN